MAKNIVFFSDGTGNDQEVEEEKTNVAMLYDRALDDDVRQVTAYDEGVGVRKRDFLGKLAGKGISANINDGYSFIASYYKPGDNIFLFGFSRGAYTVRSLAALIGLCGIPRREDEAVPEATIAAAYAAYRIGNGDGGRKREDAGAAFRAKCAYPEHDRPENRAVYFIGVWDTVRSLGLPIRGKNLELSHWPHNFHDHNLSEDVRYAYHALSIDDERQAYQPTIWNEPTEAQQKGKTQAFEQVWFPGMHRDVGGGYKERGLANITLRWMMERALKADPPLLLDPEFASDPYRGLEINANDEPHDSRGSWKRKIAYPREVRTVRKGKQQPGSTTIEKTGEGDVSEHWLDRLKARYPDYNSPSMREHPDYQLAVKQLDAGQPATGPWQHIVPKD